ncbi:MAG: YtxH domain-containing protein [Nitrospira sp.]|nr:YtxH domain-containing protein [Nitrospira sp.]
MDNHEARCSSQAVALAFLGGAIAGAVAGILLAPKSGEETRRELRGYARKAEEEVIEKAKEARAALDEMIERGKHFVAEKREDVEAAVTAGKDAMKEKMDKCCS